MKKLVCIAICAMAVMIGCKNKGAAAEGSETDSTKVDSVMAELNDTTPLAHVPLLQQSAGYADSLLE